MSNYLKTVSFLLALVSSLQVHAQLSAADQKGVEECYNGCMAAFEKSDATALCQWFAENAEHVSPMGEIVRGHDKLLPYYTHLFEWFKTMPQPDSSELKISNWQTRYLATDLVQATYTEENISHFGDKKQSNIFSYSLVLRKTKGKWLIELLTMTPVQPMPGGGK